MRLTCSQKDLANALSITSHAVGSNNTLPVLNNVMLKAEGKKVFFTTTNLEVAISYSIEAEIKNEGEVTIPSKLLTNYVGYLRDDKIDLSVEEGETILVKTADSKTKIKGIAAAEFPSIPTVEKEGGFSIPAKDFLTAINQVAFAAALNTTRPILTGVYFVIEGDSLKMVTTDSYRLAEKTLRVKDVNGEVKCIVPVKTILEIGAILGVLKDEMDVVVTISKNQIHFEMDKVKLTSRLIEGMFPNYKQVIPKESKTSAKLQTSELNLVLKRINLFAKENNNKVLFKLDSGGLHITTDRTQIGVGEVDMQTKVDGDDGEIALNSQYILDLLSNVGVGEVEIQLGEKTSPATFKPVGKDDYVHIIMPLKI